MASHALKQTGDLPDLRKVQFTVDQATVDKLEESRRLHSDSSLAQTFRRAVALQHFIDKTTRDGYEVLVRKGDDVYKLFIPGSSSYRAAANGG